MNRLVYEREKDIFELEDETIDWNDIEVEGISYGLLEMFSYRKLIEDDEEVEG